MKTKKILATAFLFLIVIIADFFSNATYAKSLIYVIQAQKEKSTPCPKPISDFDPSGRYFIREKGYSQFDSFVLSVTQADNVMSASGSIYLVDGEVVKIISIKINKSILTFRTETLRGFSYEFKGNWLSNAVFYESDDLQGAKLLEGTLQRIKNGTQRGEIKTEFIYHRNCEKTK